MKSNLMDLFMFDNAKQMATSKEYIDYPCPKTIWYKLGL